MSKITCDWKRARNLCDATCPKGNGSDSHPRPEQLLTALFFEIPMSRDSKR